MKKAAFFTLGCKVNYYETESLKDLFEKEGYEITAFDQIADVYIINTCTVTHLSDRKSRQLIRQARKRAPEARIVVTGCYAQVSAHELEKIPDVDLITGTYNRYDLPGMVEGLEGEGPVNKVRPFDESPVFERLSYRANRSRTRAFLKVQEGCDQKCRYCIVPAARGPVRSAPLKDVMSEVDEIVARGYREVVLTGIRLGLYEDEKENYSLSSLIKEIEKKDGIERIRLSSLEPSDFTGELIDTIATSPKVCPHLHIPLQSGDDQILNEMNRPYNTEEYSFITGVLRDQIPGIAIGTDIITGFPGETDELHRQSYNYIEKISFSRLHIFRFSPRRGTEAYDLPHQVDPRDKEARWKEIAELGRNMARAYRQKFKDTDANILVEKVSAEDNYIEGLTEHYLKVRAKTEESPKNLLGRIVSVKIENTEEEILEGVFTSGA